MLRTSLSLEVIIMSMWFVYRVEKSLNSPILYWNIVSMQLPGGMVSQFQGIWYKYPDYAGGVVSNSRSHEQICNECLALLDSNGVNVDESFRSLIAYFFSTDRHLSFEDIKDYVQSNNLAIDEDSIRSVMKLLVEYGFAMEKAFGTSIRYEHLHVGEHHDHFYCLKCGTIIEFFSPIIEEAQQREATAHGFHAFTHKMQIHGLCAKCFNKSVKHLVPLAMVHTGGKFRVMKIAGGGPLGFRSDGKRRLHDMGITSGVYGDVVANHGGRLVVAIKGNRLALGKGMSQRVMVSLVN